MQFTTQRITPGGAFQWGAAAPSGAPILSNLIATAITGIKARLRMTFTVPT